MAKALAPAHAGKGRVRGIDRAVKLGILLSTRAQTAPHTHVTHPTRNPTHFMIEISYWHKEPPKSMGMPSDVTLVGAQSGDPRPKAMSRYAYMFRVAELVNLFVWLSLSVSLSLSDIGFTHHHPRTSRSRRRQSMIGV